MALTVRDYTGSPPEEKGCTLEIASFDFVAKTVTVEPLSDAWEALEQGRFLWIDMQYSDAVAAQEILNEFSGIHQMVLDSMFSGEPETHLSRFPDYMHLSIPGCRIDSEGQLGLERIDVVISQRYLLTVHQQPHFIIDTLKGEYEFDFAQFAQTPSFLIYEFWDAVIEHYADIQKKLERMVEQLQNELIHSTGDTMFGRVSAIGENLLHFRGILMPARTVLAELASRRSQFISEATQAALNSMAGTLERIIQDVLVDREILTQALTLHMSMLSHKTNQAMSKLAIVSTIFLPLTFLAGIYGMNFHIFPELEWRYGYLFFWGVCAVIVGVLIVILRRARML